MSGEPQSGEAHLAFLRARHSVRDFTPAPIARETLERILQAAVTAPSSTNRQPWRFAVVVEPALRARVVAAVRGGTEEMKSFIRKSHHSAEFRSYGDSF